MSKHRKMGALREVLHDMNNALAVLVGTASLADCPVCPGGRCARPSRVNEQVCISQLRGHVQRAGEILKGSQSPKGIRVTVREHLEHLVTQSRPELPWETTWTSELPERILDKKIWFFPALERVVTENAISNWKKAGITRLWIRTYSDGAALVQEIIDNGCGMDKNTLAVVRTGRVLGHGEKGMGCQIIRRACAESGRTVTWESIEHVGTKMTIRSVFLDSD